MIDGRKFPISGITYKENGEINTIQVVKSYMVHNYVDINSDVQGAEKVDFSSCYIEEFTTLVKPLVKLIEDMKEEMNDMARNAIPAFDENFSMEKIMQKWTEYRMLNVYHDGLKDALSLLTE